MRTPVIKQWLEIENSMLIDIPRGAKRPLPGKPWVYYLFGWNVEKRKYKSGIREVASRVMFTVEGSTKREVNQNARKIVDGATVTPEGFRDQCGKRKEPKRRRR